MNRRGTWWVQCKSDPRWNAHGESSSVGGFEIPAEAKAHLAKKREELKAEPPEDCEFGYMKD